jgi:hypothetical protein
MFDGLVLNLLKSSEMARVCARINRGFPKSPHFDASKLSHHQFFF